MTPDQINDFFSFFYQGRVGQITWWLRLIAGVATSAMLAAIFVVSIKFRQLMTGSPKHESTPEPTVSPDVVPQPWQEVMEKIESANPSDWNFAVIRADAILDGVLKDMGLAGDSLGERLRQLDASKLNSLENVWEAHKIRNRIAHEADRVLSQEEANRAVTHFKWALKELQYLQE